MRLSEISQNAGIDKFIVALRNHIGRAASQGAPAQLTWDAVAQMSRANGFEFAADYETFKAMYDANPIIQNLVANFNDKGIVLKVPGVTDKKGKTPDPKTSQGEVDKIAASNAEANLKDSMYNETYYGREIYFIKFTGKPATSIDNVMYNMKKKLVSFEVVDARAATGGEFGNDETEQAFSVDQADGSKIDKWINKTNYVELLDGFERHGANVTEISNELKQRYHDKATSTINNVKPYTKKGEYQDLAKRLVARREAGLNKIKNSRNDMRLRDITDEAIVSQDDPNRDAIRAHQARQHRAGNKISWQQAKQEIDDKLNPPQPKKQRAPKAPRRPSLGMSSARFQKIMKGAAQDFQSDFGDQEYGLEDVAWDLAGSLMHDPEVSKYVRGTIARNAGMRPDEVDSNVIQDYIADEIFSAGSNS